MIMYRTTSGEIEKREVLRETAARVILSSNVCSGEYKEAKRSSWANWFYTWEEAKDFLIKDEQEKINCAKEGVKMHEAKLAIIKDLKEDG